MHWASDTSPESSVPFESLPIRKGSLLLRHSEIQHHRPEDREYQYRTGCVLSAAKSLVSGWAVSILLRAAGKLIPDPWVDRVGCERWAGCWVAGSIFRWSWKGGLLNAQGTGAGLTNTLLGSSPAGDFITGYSPVGSPISYYLTSGLRFLERGGVSLEHPPLSTTS